ncbi:hypothetical protein LINGRAHAP2_LOCUS1723 [Linum grandiflorum]
MGHISDELNKSAQLPATSNPPESSTNPNSSLQFAAANVREDGELSSSSDDDENCTSTKLESSATDNPSVPTQPCLAESTKKSIHQILTVNGNCTASPVNNVDFSIHASAQANDGKSGVNNRLPSKSSDSGWQAALAGDNNLVIRFSDEDSGSDSEDCTQRKDLRSKIRITGPDGNRKFLSHSSIPKTLQHAGANVRNKSRCKPTLSRTFVSPVSNINRGIKSGAGTAQGGQTSRGRSFKNSNRSTQGNTFELGLSLNQAKLQDLRQQIAMREKEMKLKADQQNKLLALVSARENSAKNLSKNTPAKSNIYPDAEPNEPDRKRAKVSGSYSNQLKADCQQVNVPPKSIQPSNVKTAGVVQQDLVYRSSNSSPKKRKDSDFIKSLQQHNERHFISSANPASTNIDNVHVIAKNIGLQESVDNDLLKIIQPPGSSKMAMNEKHTFHNQGASDHNITSPVVETMCQESLINVNFSSYLGNVSENSNKNLCRLVEMEEKLDKELEEAQGLRYRFEIEERNALKAYRRAQRALIEATARCTELYHKRELHSSQFGSLIMNGPSSLFSAGEHDQCGMDSSPAQKACQNILPVPSSIHQKQLSDGQNLRSKPFCVPQLSTSEPLNHGFMNTASRLSSPTKDPNVSSDEDEEVFLMEHDIDQCSNMQLTSHTSCELLNDLDRPSDKRFPLTDSQDPLILEASLRSKLYARFGLRSLPKTTVSSQLESADEVGTENDNESERTQMSNSSLPGLAAKRLQECHLKGEDNPERVMSEPPAQDMNLEKTSHLMSDSGQIEYTSGGYQSTPNMSSPPIAWRSVFEQLKVMSSTAFKHVEDDNDVESMEAQYSNLTTNSMEQSTKDICDMEIGSFSSNAAVDPFWPLCMYELRGKCNNSDCPWQHAADFSAGTRNKNRHDGSHDPDCSPGLQNERTTAKHPNCGGILNLPTYWVGPDVIKARRHAYEFIVASKHGECWRWQKSFSAYLAISCLLVKDLPANELFACGKEGRIEVHGSWNAQLSCFRSRNGLANYENQVIPSTMQALEMSLATLSQEVNKVENMKKVNAKVGIFSVSKLSLISNRLLQSLSTLSRAIESDPTSEVLWIMYLLVYYSNIQSIEKNDMFSYAVKHNARSYGLWLMYINSRIHLKDRLGAYNAAIKALCQMELTPEKNEMHGACILDLFLQMLECFCMSGNVDMAVQKICGLFGLTTYSDECHSPLLSDILKCLTVSDKYMFWVCCVYLVIYRKLPILVLQQFECEKDLSAIEWSPVDLKGDEKHRAVELVEMMVDSVQLFSDKESAESEANNRAAQCFALNHIRCVMALGRLEFCSTLLEKYLNVFPQCLELVLIAARSQATDVGGSRFDSFENALTNWPKEVPGILGLWNQYVEFALERHGPELAKELLVRWFNSISEGRYRDNTSVESLELASASNPEFLMPYSNQMDIMFGFLNLSLAKMLQNDHTEARAAINRAFKSAPPHCFNHCLVEHAAFLLNLEQGQTKYATVKERLRILKGYMDDSEALFVSEPLSKRFIKNVEKPRVEQLISNILSPVSSMFAQVNLGLKTWYGPALVPKNIGHAKELVDFVEEILEIVPSNYPLAFSVCKLLRADSFKVFGMSESVLFWASSMLADTIFHAVPVAPECVWVEAAEILSETNGADDLLPERFYRRALSVYPFSKKLWCGYKELVKDRKGGNGIGTTTSNSVQESARRRGIELGGSGF